MLVCTLRMSCTSTLWHGSAASELRCSQGMQIFSSCDLAFLRAVASVSERKAQVISRQNFGDESTFWSRRPTTADIGKETARVGESKSQHRRAGVRHPSIHPSFHPSNQPVIYPSVHLPYPSDSIGLSIRLNSYLSGYLLTS